MNPLMIDRLVLHQTNRSYSINRTMDDDQNYSHYSLVLKLNDVNSVFKKNYGDDYDLSEVALLGLQNEYQQVDTTFDHYA